MNRFRFIFVILAGLFAVSATAQDYVGSTTGGYLLSRYSLGVSDMVGLSQYDHSIATARVAALGGAYTSLGGDLSSMNINPSGLGMYTSSEVGITPSLSFGKVSSDAGYGSMKGSNKTNFAINNIGFVFTIPQAGKALNSFTFGFSYNKLADFNYTRRLDIAGSRYSLMDVFANQLSWSNSTGGMIPETSLQGIEAWYNMGFDMWGATLGYKTYMLEPGLGNYYVAGLSNDNVIDHHSYLRSKGSVGEYTFSGGFNFNSKFYVGFTFGFLDIYQKQYVEHAEIYSGDYGGLPNDDRVTHMTYAQQAKVDGTAFNFKVGVIYRPIEELRIGVALHTPNWVWVDHDYDVDMATRWGNGKIVSPVPHAPTGLSEFDFQTPTRLMAGISYTFANRGLVTFDYEAAWYGGMRLRNADGLWERAYEDAFKSTYQTRHTFRVGAEFRATDMVTLRAGFAQMGSLLKDDKLIYDSPIAYKAFNVSAGVGFRLGMGWNLDLAYVFNRTDYTDYDLFYYADIDSNGDWHNMISPDPNQWIRGGERDRHSIIASLSYRF